MADRVCSNLILTGENMEYSPDNFNARVKHTLSHLSFPFSREHGIYSEAGATRYFEIGGKNNSRPDIYVFDELQGADRWLEGLRVDTDKGWDKGYRAMLLRASEEANDSNYYPRELFIFTNSLNRALPGCKNWVPGATDKHFIYRCGEFTADNDDLGNFGEFLHAGLW